MKRETFPSHYTAFPTIVAVGTRGARKPAPKPGSALPGGVPPIVPNNVPPVTPVRAPGQ